MLARLESAAVFGVDAHPVHIEVDVGLGLPFFRMVGLPDASVKESRDRVRAAIRNSGFQFPTHRITINLAPADVRKAGSSFDLPIALGILAAEGVLTSRELEHVVLVGELSLDGTIHGARGILPTFEFSADQSRAARAKVEALLTQTRAELWIEHDMATHAKLPKSPAYIE